MLPTPQKASLPWSRRPAAATAPRPPDSRRFIPARSAAGLRGDLTGDRAQASVPGLGGLGAVAEAVDDGHGQPGRAPPGAPAVTAFLLAGPRGHDAAGPGGQGLVQPAARAHPRDHDRPGARAGVEVEGAGGPAARPEAAAEGARGRVAVRHDGLGVGDAGPAIQRDQLHPGARARIRRRQHHAAVAGVAGEIGGEFGGYERARSALGRRQPRAGRRGVRRRHRAVDVALVPYRDIPSRSNGEAGRHGRDAARGRAGWIGTAPRAHMAMVIVVPRPGTESMLKSSTRRRAPPRPSPRPWPVVWPSVSA